MCEASAAAKVHDHCSYSQAADTVEVVAAAAAAAAVYCSYCRRFHWDSRAAAHYMTDCAVWQTHSQAHTLAAEGIASIAADRTFAGE